MLLLPPAIIAGNPTHVCTCAVLGGLQAIFQEGYAFSPGPGCEQYTAPSEGPIESYTTFIRSLPDTAPPEVSTAAAQQQQAFGSFLCCWLGKLCRDLLQC